MDEEIKQFIEEMEEHIRIVERQLFLDLINTLTQGE